MTQQSKKERKEKKEKPREGEKRQGGSKEGEKTLHSTVVPCWRVLRSCAPLIHLEILF